jgi:hypothetical protein
LGVVIVVTGKRVGVGVSRMARSRIIVVGGVVIAIGV